MSPMKFPFALPILVGLASLNLAHGQGERLFDAWDKNKDGFLERNEVPEGPRRFFDRKDANGDGKISRAEHLDTGGTPPRGKAEMPTGNAAFTIRQTWDQEPDGYDRPVYAVEPSKSSGKIPVVIVFHGAGGSAANAPQRWSSLFPNYLLVAPQGYSKTWNVHGETSNAPDVAFFKLLITEIGKRYPKADMNNVALIGSSNGAAYIYRLLIEVRENLFRTAVPQVSSLLETQQNEGSFWMPSQTTDDYDTRTEPVKTGRRVLYLHGTEDSVVPFAGGLRGRFPHHSAQATANIWARHFGYDGDDLTLEDGVDLGNGLIRQDYEGAEFTFIAVDGGNHGLGPHQEAARELTRQFVEAGIQ